MKKIIVNGLCATLVCFFLSSFSANSNHLAGTTPGISTSAPSQDTTHKMKKKMKMNKTSGDTTKMKMKKKPA
jgi:hypothetical protein